jgi:elongation factor 1-gamma
MSLKLITVSYGIRTHKISVAARYAGVDLAIEEFFPRGQPEDVVAEFKKKNPNGLIPVLETPEGFLYESNAILRYIARHNENAKLYGSTDFERALVDQYVDWVALYLEPAAGPVLRTYLGYVPYEKASFEKSLEELKKALRVLDDRVKQSKYLAGETLTIADIAVVTGLSFFFRYVLDEKTRKPFHNLTKYYETVANEENFKQVLGKPVLAKTALTPAGSQ